MQFLNMFTLSIRNKEDAIEYNLRHTKKIFYTGIALSMIRLFRLILSMAIDNPTENFIYFIPEFDVMKWVTFGV